LYPARFVLVTGLQVNVAVVLVLDAPEPEVVVEVVLEPVVEVVVPDIGEVEPVEGVEVVDGDVVDVELEVDEPVGGAGTIVSFTGNDTLPPFSAVTVTLAE
jgi:hypothetical protein